MIRRVSLREGFSADDVSEDTIPMNRFFASSAGAVSREPGSRYGGGSRKHASRNTRGAPKSVNMKAKHRQRDARDE
jgi:hypothetical protein